MKADDFVTRYVYVAGIFLIIWVVAKTIALVLL